MIFTPVLIPFHYIIIYPLPFVLNPYRPAFRRFAAAKTIEISGFSDTMLRLFFNIGVLR